jgi:hypothetical protein
MDILLLQNRNGKLALLARTSLYFADGTVVGYAGREAAFTESSADIEEHPALLAIAQRLEAEERATKVAKVAAVVESKAPHFHAIRAGADLAPFAGITDIDAQIQALQAKSPYTWGDRSDPKVGLKSGAGYGSVVLFSGALSYRFFKQGGRVPHFAPIGTTEAKGLLLGTHELRYIKGGNGFRISLKSAK